MTTEGTETAEAVAQLEAINEKLKALGLDSVDALITSRDGLAEQRDKLAKANDEAQKIIQRHGSEIDALKKKVADPGEGEAKDDQSKSKAKVEPKPEDELAELEKTLTDEEKARADEFYVGIKDEAIRDALIEDPAERLKLLKGVRSSFAQPRKSLFEKPGEKKAVKSAGAGSPDVSAMFKEYAKRKGFVPEGPSGGSTVGVHASVSDKPERPKEYRLIQ